MAVRKRPPARKSKAPGRNIPDSQRHTVKEQLRVPQIISHAIRERSAELGIDKSAYVAKAVSEEVARAMDQSSEEP